MHEPHEPRRPDLDRGDPDPILRDDAHPDRASPSSPAAPTDALEREHALRVKAERDAERIARLQALTAALSEAATPKQVADALLHEGMLALGAVAGGVTRLSADGRTQEVLAIRGPGIDPEQLAAWATFALAEPYPVNDAVSRREIIEIGSLSEFRERYPAIALHIEAAGYEAYFAAPLEIEGRVIGAINYNFRERRRFTGEDRAFFLALARQGAQAFERARLLDAERSARRSAEAASRAKDEFLAVMSHELRTPLTAVIGYADLLASGVSGPLEDLQLKQVARIRASAWHLASIIDEILGFVRLESGKERISSERVDVVRAALDSIDLLAPAATAKGLSLGLEANGKPVWSRTDVAKLRQILLNLIGNAVKFTDAGSVIVSVAPTAGRVRVVVRDTGPGIAADQLERIFEPFTQLDQSDTRAQGGTGLGLAVSRSLARLLGGEVGVTSRVGAGSEFTLTLPGAEDAVP